MFGESAFLHRGRRTASVTAVTDCRILILRGGSVEKLMRRDPALGTRLRAQLTMLMAERLASRELLATA